MSDTPYRLDDQVGFLLRQVSQRHALIFQAEAPEGLTPTQFSTLIRLYENGPSSQNELGRAAAMDVATIKGVVDRLRAKGLIGLTPYPGDKRRRLITLTPKAKGMIDRLHKAGARITAATLAPLTPEEQAQLGALLRRLV
ncbi:MarR family winged helix-turn-helix transcriptional regulator [Oceaniglobus ichthyenteri]|uniref:MarR family winged helix-turn-helix transcriptional regulator n=1 Tax=Oceaniglobus ichthyenteri TaxID=2136177 RepID=UPI001F0BF018|nr:MarR family transcriptional regulator [Oceaniglobus ichthyenteri]